MNIEDVRYALENGNTDEAVVALLSLVEDLSRKVITLTEEVVVLNNFADVHRSIHDREHA